MARTGRISSRTDVVLFGVCVLLSLLAMVLPGRLREPVASALRRTLVASSLLALSASAAQAQRDTIFSHADSLRGSLGLARPSSRYAHSDKEAV